MKKTILLTTLLLFYFSSSFADTSYFIDFNKVLNNSKAGGEAQKKLKKKFEDETSKFKKVEADIRKEETKIISQKKSITNEEYKEKVGELRKKVADLQKNKKASFVKITKARNDARITLLKSVNPIIKKYMQENKIRLVIDKKSVLVGDNDLEITDQIIGILNKEVSSIKIN
jgi:outer membrane protein